MSSLKSLQRQSLWIHVCAAAAVGTVGPIAPPSGPVLSDYMPEQTVDMPVSQVELAASAGEAGSSWSRANDTTSAAAVAVEKSVGEARPLGFKEYSATTASVFGGFSGKVKLDLGTRKNNRTYTSILDMWLQDAIYRKSQQYIGWSDAFVRYLDHTAQIDFSHTASHEQRCRCHNLIFYVVLTKIDRPPPLSKRPGYNEAKTALVEMQKRSRQEMKIVHIPTEERTRLNDKLDPETRGYIWEWLSIDWETFFAKERELPTSSSSSQRSSTSWWSTRSWSSNWKGWQQHSWQDDKWSDQR